MPQTVLRVRKLTRQLNEQGIASLIFYRTADRQLILNVYEKYHKIKD